MCGRRENEEVPVNGRKHLTPRVAEMQSTALSPLPTRLNQKRSESNVAYNMQSPCCSYGNHLMSQRPPPIKYIYVLYIF